MTDHRSELIALYPRLLGFARRFIRNKEDAEDAVQETICAALKGHFRGESLYSTWVMGILQFKVCDFHKKKKWLVLGEDYDLAAAALITAPTQHIQLELSEALEALNEVIGPKRQTLVDFCIGHTAEDISIAEGIPLSTVKTRVHYARKEIEEHYK